MCRKCTLPSASPAAKAALSLESMGKCQNLDTAECVTSLEHDSCMVSYEFVQEHLFSVHQGSGT